MTESGEPSGNGSGHELRDWLRGRQLPAAQVPIPVDPVAYAAAERAVDRAARGLAQAQAAGVADLGAHRALAQAARAELAAQPVRVLRLRCLPPAQWEALVDAHPPTDEQRRQGWQWDTATFRPALLAAAHVPGEGQQPLSAVEWCQVAAEGQMAPGELAAVFAAAVELNSRAPSVSLGKG